LHRARFFFSLLFSFYFLSPPSSSVGHTHTQNTKHKQKQNPKKNQYDLTLVASDSLNESVTRVVILIKDSNDLPPIFNQTMYTAHALEELADPLPFKLLQVASTYNSGFFISFFHSKKSGGIYLFSK
jgi:hypothetical protein